MNLYFKKGMKVFATVEILQTANVSNHSLSREIVMFEFKICESDEEVASALKLRYEVYCIEKGWISPSRFQNGEEFDEYDKYSKMLIASNESGQVIGTSRIIMPSKLGLPIEKFIDMEDLDMSRAAEVSRLAVREDARNNEKVVFFGLTRLAWEHFSTKSIRHWGAVVDQPLYNLLKRLDMPFIKKAEPIWYLGSKSVPVVVDFAKTKDVLFSSFVNGVMKRRGCEDLDDV